MVIPDSVCKMHSNPGVQPTPASRLVMTPNVNLCRRDRRECRLWIESGHSRMLPYGQNRTPARDQINRNACVVRAPRLPDPLDAQSTDTSRVEHVLRPYDGREMTAYPVSTKVNNVKNDRPALIKPIS